MPNLIGFKTILSGVVVVLTAILLIILPKIL